MSAGNDPARWRAFAEHTGSAVVAEILDELDAARAEIETLRVNGEKLFNKGIDHFNRAEAAEAERDKWQRVAQDASRAFSIVEAERDTLRARVEAVIAGAEQALPPLGDAPTSPQ